MRFLPGVDSRIALAVNESYDSTHKQLFIAKLAWQLNDDLDLSQDRGMSPPTKIVGVQTTVVGIGSEGAIHGTGAISGVILGAN